MRQSRAIQRSEYNFESSGVTIASATLGLLDDSYRSWLLYDNVFDSFDPNFLSCRHFSIGQQVFYNLGLAAYYN